MGLQLRWVEDDERDLVAIARMRSYAPAVKDLPRFQESVRLDPRVKSGDFLLAELDGDPIGTATSLSLATWVRGGPARCQGVAYVGTSRTHRRGGSGDQPGVATRIMHEVLRKARERNQSVSALMPFRNSFYERFGYGVVEHRCVWNVPTHLLPVGEFDGYRQAVSGDVDALAVCRQKQVCRGQCDIKRTRETWQDFLRQSEDGFLLVDRATADGPVRGYIDTETEVKPDGRWHLKVMEMGYEDGAALLRALRLIASMKDQYATCAFSLPRDVPVDRLLRESQLPHRIVPHVSASCAMSTRMLMRILDHKAFLEAMVDLPPEGRGRAVVEVHETEQTASRFQIEFSDGRATVKPSDQSPQFQCKDHVWAAIACGDLSAETAVRAGLAACVRQSASAALQLLSAGPVPFCAEAF